MDEEGPTLDRRNEVPIRHAIWFPKQQEYHRCKLRYPNNYQRRTPPQDPAGHHLRRLLEGFRHHQSAAPLDQARRYRITT